MRLSTLPAGLMLAGGVLTASIAFAETAPRPRYLDAALPTEARIDDLLPRLTLAEKVGFVHGNSKFTAGGVERLGVPRLWLADGPQGVREEVGADSWEPAGRTDDFATALPVGIALASTWNPDLVQACGRVIGEEARQRDKHVMLGPAFNIMRSPLCGRNYDYFGEDPWLAGRMTVAYVRGMQAEQVVACLKHFAANNQEQDRGTIDVEMDERTLREIYLPAFEAGVREAGALSVMGAYNKFRGEHCCHNDYLLNQILKKEWGFRGAVVSDWGGTHDTAQAARNGLDLEMGTHGAYEDYFLARPFLAGLQAGTYPVALLDDKVRRNLRMLLATGALDGQRRPGSINTPEHLAVARQAAEEGMVLLKNTGGLLSLDLSQVKRIVVIGENAVRTFAQGGNSAGVKAFQEITALAGIRTRVGAQAKVEFALGYRQPEQRRSAQRDAAGVRASESAGAEAANAATLADEAVRAAKAADVVIFVGGLSHQSFADDEGTDRRDLSLPASQDALIARLVAANPSTVVVLIAGSPVQMDPWLAQVPAVLQAWYGGSGAGSALAAMLFGDVNPSGKLPCTFPRVLTDSPAHAAGLARQFPGENGTVHYDEGLLVGYRWFDAKQIEPLFAFGHGLSYTEFTYSDLKLFPENDGDGPTLSVQFSITNTGSREGAEVAQLYVHPVNPRLPRPLKELKGFAKITLKPGERKSVTLPLGFRAFAFYDPAQPGWAAEAGDYLVQVGSSSRDLRLEQNYRLAVKR